MAERERATPQSDVDATGAAGKRELFDENGDSRGFYSERNRVNDLTGREWLYWTRSVINRPYPLNCQHKLRRAHGGQKPPDLCADLIKVFTKSDQRVLDPFMGVGGVLLGAALAGREATGIDVNQRWIDIYHQVCALEQLKVMPALHGAAEEQLERLDGSFDLVLTDVPYWNMDVAPRSTGTYKKVGQAARPKPVTRLGQFGPDSGYADKQAWLAAMRRVFALCASRLEDDGYLLTFIGDMYFDGSYHCLSAELAGAIAGIDGLVWQANIIWYDVSKKLHIYGYQYRYIPSLIHQNVLVFRKSASGSMSGV